MSEINVTFLDMLAELGVQINLLLIASAEARLRLDLMDRIENKRKDAISRKFRELDQGRKARAKKGIRLVDVLKTWEKSTTGMKRKASDMGRLLVYRHWVAHGRYFAETKRDLRQPDPFDIWFIVSSFFNALPEFQPLPDQSR